MNGALPITTGYVRLHYGSPERSHVDRQVQRRLFGAVTRPKILSDVEGALEHFLFTSIQGAAFFQACTKKMYYQVLTLESKTH